MEAWEDLLAGEEWPIRYLVLADEATSSPYTDSYLLDEGLEDDSPASAEAPGDAKEVASGEEEASENIYLFDEQGQAYELSRTSPLIRAIRNQRTSLKRLYVPERLREKLLRAMPEKR